MTRLDRPTMAESDTTIKIALVTCTILFAFCSTAHSLFAFQIIEIREVAEQDAAAEQEVVPAPETTGKDCDGKEFSLSDYRGKVVLLCFWGDLFIPCREIYPSLNVLVAVNAERPFVVIGVNADQDASTVQQLRSDGTISWRSFQIDRHKLVSDWKVKGFPSLFLIDASGNIVESGNSLRDFEKLGSKIDDLVLPLMDLGEEELEALLDAAKDKRADRK